MEREIFNVTTMERLGTIVLNINQNYFNELIGLPRQFHELLLFAVRHGEMLYLHGIRRGPPLERYLA